MTNVERLLYDVRQLEARKEVLEEILSIHNDGMRAIDTSTADGSGKTNRFHSETESVAIKNIENKEKHSGELQEITRKLHILNRAIQALSETEQKIIKLKYIDQNPWWEVAHSLNFTERRCRQLRGKAINTIKEIIKDAI